jgi:phage shock protein A
MPEDENNSNRNFTEVLVAIGRIEEGIKALRQSIERQDTEIKDVKEDVQGLKMDVQQLKTQRSTLREHIAVAVSIVALLTAVSSVLVI